MTNSFVTLFKVSIMSWPYDRTSDVTGTHGTTARPDVCRCDEGRASTYCVAEPVFILVSGVTVVHVHSLSLDDQTFLKEDVECYSRIPGRKSWSHQKSKHFWKGRGGAEGPPAHRPMMHVRMMYRGFCRCLGPECPDWAGAECIMWP